MFRQSAFAPPPVAATRPYVHPDGRPDPYAWLRDPAYPDVREPAILDHLRAENAYVEAVLGGPGDLRPALFAELKARIIEDDSGPPEWVWGRYVRWRFAAGRQYREWFRMDRPHGAEESILDENARAAGLPFYALRGMAISPDHRLMAVLEDTDGSERLTLRIKDLGTGEFLPDTAANCSYGLAWSADSRQLFYVRRDEELRPRWVHRHALGAGDDPLVHFEADPAFMLAIRRLPSGRFLSIVSAAKTSTELRVVPLAAPETPARVLVARRPEHECSAFDRGEEWLILTNDRHPNFRVVRAPLDSPAEAGWTEVVAPQDDVLLEAIGGTHDWWWIAERADALRRVRLVRGGHASAAAGTLIRFPDAAYTLDVDQGLDWNGATLRLGYETLARPRTIFDCVVATGALELVQEKRLPDGHDPADYVVERLWSPAADGRRIPVSLVRHRRTKVDGTAPLVLYGYGAYGHSLDPGFGANRLSLLRRGAVYAIAHVRGGEELGRAWYEDGKFLNKRNTFTDFIAVAEDLRARGHGAPGRIAAMGGSAGGLLMGAVANLRPDLFAAIVAQVPFVDVLSTMLDGTLALTQLEYLEWGNPAEKAFYDCIRSYSPYDNVSAQDYPALMVTAGLADPRVTYWEPAKWVAKLRATKTGDSVLLLKTELDAGHGGGSGRYRALDEVAAVYAFLVRALALPEAPLASSP